MEPLDPDEIKNLLEKRSANFNHCQTFYDLLNTKAKDELIQGNMLRVFRGYLTEVFRETELPIAYYSPVTNALVVNGCIVTVGKGARGVESTVVLLRAPADVTGWQESFEKPLTGEPDLAKLRQDVDSVLKSLGGLNVVEAFREVQARLDEITRTQEKNSLLNPKR